MNLYKVTSSERDFILCRTETLSSGYELINDSIPDDAELEPVISESILNALSPLPGNFLSSGFSISMMD